MRYEFDITSSQGSYSVTIGEHSLVNAVSGCDIVVVDAAVAAVIPYDASPSVVMLVADESIKTLHGVESLSLQLREHGVGRQSRMLAIGGGTIQDVATLTSSLYMRGIEWVYAPTTLMAMGDSCIGGKSAINAGGFKNLLGNFNPPNAVAIDPRFALSQSIPAQMCGVAEAVKICYAGGEEPFNRFVSAIDWDAPLDAETIAEMVRQSLLAKKEIVEEDEFDTGRRQLLNFGHTFGHALESASSMQLPHGLAVALGIRSALAHPCAQASALAARLDGFAAQVLRRALEGGWSMPDVDWSRFESALDADKKHTVDHFRLVLPGPFGALRIVELPRTAEILRQCRVTTQTVVEEL